MLRQKSCALSLRHRTDKNRQGQIRTDKNRQGQKRIKQRSTVCTNRHAKCQRRVYTLLYTTLYKNQQTSQVHTTHRRSIQYNNLQQSRIYNHLPLHSPLRLFLATFFFLFAFFVFLPFLLPALFSLFPYLFPIFSSIFPSFFFFI